MENQDNKDEIKEKYDKISEYYKNYKDVFLNIRAFNEYKTKNKKIKRHLKTLTNLVIEELCFLPQTFNEALKNMCTFDNVNDFTRYLDNLLDVTETIKKAYDILLALILIDGQKYEFDPKYNDSLLKESNYFHHANVTSVMSKKSWTDESKYESLHEFEKDLTNSERGELLVQKLLLKKKFNKPLMTLDEKLACEMSNKYYNHYEHARMKHLTINCYIDEYGCILESDFVKNKKNK